MFCRLWAKEVSAIAPQLKANNVRLIGVGVEELGLGEFIMGEFFAGELFVDSGKKTYAALGFKRFSILSILKAIFSSEARAAIAEAKRRKLGGDFKGDGLQNGGAFIVSAGGKDLLFNFKQERPAEHVPNKTFMDVLGIPYDAKEEEKRSNEGECKPVHGDGKSSNGEASSSNAGQTEPVCTDDVCSLPQKANK